MTEPAAVPPRRRGFSWSRAIVARVLTVIAVLLAFVGMLAYFVDRTLLDEDGFRSTASALIDSDPIRERVALRAVDGLYASVDVEAAIAERLPENQKGLAPILAGLSRSAAERAAVAAFDRPRVRDLWIVVATGTQQQFVELLEDKGTFVRTGGGAVVLDLRPIMIEVGEQVAVVGRVAERLPESTGRVVILEAEQLEAVQTGTRILRAVASWLWLIAIAIAALAVWLARGRRRLELRAIAIGVLVVGLLLLAARQLLGGYFVDELAKNEAVKPAAQDAWDILTTVLAERAWVWVALGLLLLAGVWLAGSSRTGTQARARLAPALLDARRAYGLTALIVVALAVFLPIFQRGLLSVIVLLVLLVAGIETLRRQVRREHPG